MRSETLEFAKYLTGLRTAYTADTETELAFLTSAASGKSYIVEVGVYEGVASRRMSRAMASGGELVLVDPYFRETKLERWLNISFKEIIAKRTASGSAARTRFLRLTSRDAASTIANGSADLIFIDARHDYESVREDFQLWSPKLKPGGVIAFHDSRNCAARPEISENDGPVRLCAEISQGVYGPWALHAQADSISAFTQSPSASAS